MIAKIIIVFLAFIIYFININVDKEITQNDIIAIQYLSVEDRCLFKKNNIQSQLDCLSAIQASVQRIGSRECANSSEIIEPLSFVQRDRGCCFDRARFIEKAARYYGFETRRVFLIQPYKGWSITNFLPLNQKSHAVSEIRLSHGWVGIDSNYPIILVNKKKIPFGYGEISKFKNDLKNVSSPEWYTGDVDVYYGLYSRHGDFYGLDILGPDINFEEIVLSQFQK